MQNVGLLPDVWAHATTPTALYNLLGDMGSASFQGGSVMLDQRIKTKGLRFDASDAQDRGKGGALRTPWNAMVTSV